MKNRGYIADAFLERFGTPKGGLQCLAARPFWRPFPIKNRKNGIQKIIQKSIPKKYRKMMPKGSQNDAKMDAKIEDFSFLSEFLTF